MYWIAGENGGRLHGHDLETGIKSSQDFPELPVNGDSARLVTSGDYFIYSAGSTRVLERDGIWAMLKEVSNVPSSSLTAWSSTAQPNVTAGSHGKHH